MKNKNSCNNNNNINNNNKIEDNNGNKEEKEKETEREGERAVSYYYSTEKIKWPIKQVIDLFIIRYLLNV